MARFNEILVGRYSRSFQKLFGMKGPAPAPQLASEVSITHTVFSGVENRWLESWERFAQMISFGPGGAGTFNNFRLRNPVNSNVIAVMEKLKLITFAADQPFVVHGTATTDLATPQALTNSRLDGRERPTPTLIGSSEQLAVPTALTNPVNTDQFSFPAAGGFGDVMSFEDQEIVLVPGDAIQMRNNIAVIQLTVVFWWRERFLEDSERT